MKTGDSCRVLGKETRYLFFLLIAFRKNMNASWQIYNLHMDLAETTDVAAQHPEATQQLEAIIRKRHQHATILEWGFIDPCFRNKGKRSTALMQQ